jgi:hypothetical protein
VIQHSDWGFPTSPDVLEYLAISFCVHAYHLVEHIETYDPVHSSRARQLVVDGTALGVCRDVATVAKHAEMKSQPVTAGGRRAGPDGPSLVLVPGEASDTGETKYAATCAILVGDKRFVATQLVVDAVNQWRSFGLPEVAVRPGGIVRSPHWLDLPDLPPRDG